MYYDDSIGRAEGSFTAPIGHGGSECVHVVFSARRFPLGPGAKPYRGSVAELRENQEGNARDIEESHLPTYHPRLYQNVRAQRGNCPRDYTVDRRAGNAQFPDTGDASTVRQPNMHYSRSAHSSPQPNTHADQLRPQGVKLGAKTEQEGPRRYRSYEEDFHPLRSASSSHCSDDSNVRNPVKEEHDAGNNDDEGNPSTMSSHSEDISVYARPYSFVMGKP